MTRGQAKDEKKLKPLLSPSQPETKKDVTVSAIALNQCFGSAFEAIQCDTALINHSFNPCFIQHFIFLGGSKFHVAAFWYHSSLLLWPLLKLPSKDLCILRARYRFVTGYDYRDIGRTAGICYIQRNIVVVNTAVINYHLLPCDNKEKLISSGPKAFTVVKLLSSADNCSWINVKCHIPWGF